MSRTFQALCVAACAFATLIAPASAAETTRSHAAVTVHYGDLNLASEAGAKVLIRRLDQAARQVCGGDAFARGLARREQRTCRTEAVTQAVADVNQPMVTTMFAERQDGRFAVAQR